MPIKAFICIFFNTYTVEVLFYFHFCYNIALSDIFLFKCLQKADPTQFLQVHGRPCKVHLDPAVAAAGDSPAIM